MTPDRRSKVVSADDLKRLSEVSGSDFRMVTPGLGGSDTILLGEFRQIRLRAGLTLHTTNTREMHDLRTEAMQKPGLTVSLFLKGQVKVWLGGRAMEMGAGPAAPGPADVEAVVIARAQPDSFVRQSLKGAHIRKVNVTVTPEWLEHGAADNLHEYSTVMRFSRNHLATLRWKASPRLVALAEQLLRPPHHGAPLQNLYYESRSIDLVAEAIEAITDAPSRGHAVGLHAVHYRRVRRACAFIDAHLGQDLTLQSIADAAGMNPGSLQRLFRAIEGATIFEYVRGRKLDRAREALERDNISVGEAAYLVGYKTLGNFSTAFRRRFGISPKQIRTLY
jgi:AraC-like DNA-binding protein